MQRCVERFIRYIALRESNKLLPSSRTVHDVQDRRRGIEVEAVDSLNHGRHRQRRANLRVELAFARESRGNMTYRTTEFSKPSFDPPARPFVLALHRFGEKSRKLSNHFRNDVGELSFDRFELSGRIHDFLIVRYDRVCSRLVRKCSLLHQAELTDVGINGGFRLSLLLSPQSSQSSPCAFDSTLNEFDCRSQRIPIIDVAPFPRLPVGRRAEHPRDDIG